MLQLTKHTFWLWLLQSQVCLVVLLGYVRDCEHLIEVVCHVLLVIDAEKAVSHIVVYYLTVQLERLNLIYHLLNLVWRFLELR